MLTRGGAALKPHIHYEAAFEDFIRHAGIPYVAVDEAKRAAFREAKLKSFDFIVYSEHGSNWLVDVKGRRWATRANTRKPAWENWVTQDDLDGLTQWQTVFGEGFRALLVFAYWIQVEADPPAEIVHEFRDERYVFAGVPVEEYKLHARVRSPKWGTVNMPTREFAGHVRPMRDLL
ncbi:MAG: HYExAFE family protein [Phycisphaerae bacterium]|nr:HYExAFE family protein [Phycisphaerae bacterium]